jgi:hypothetical protein
VQAGLLAGDEPNDVENPDEVGKRIAAQWTGNRDAAGDAPPVQESGSDPVADSSPHEQVGEPSTDGASTEPDHPKSVIDRLKGTVQSITNAFRSSGNQDTASLVDPVALTESNARVKALTEASRLAVEAHNAKSGELRDVEEKLKSVQDLMKNVCSNYEHSIVHASIIPWCVYL